MKIKTLSLILIILLIPVTLSASVEKEPSTTATVRFELAPVNNVGYSTKPVASLTDEVKEPENGEVILDVSSDGLEMANLSDLYAYWKINLNRSSSLKLTLRIQEDMVNDIGAVIPMSVQIAGDETITGKDSEYSLYEGLASNPVYGSVLLKISCPVDAETLAGEYKGKILLTLLEV